MSEIRSQATPARDSGLTDALRDAVGDNYDHGRNPNLTGQFWHEDGIRDAIDWAGAARDLERDSWSKPRTVTSATELDALPELSVVLVGGQLAAQKDLAWFATGGEEPVEFNEEAWKAGIVVLFTPGDAG